MERCCRDEGRAVAVEKRKRILATINDQDFSAVTYGSAKLIASSCTTFLLRFFKPKVSGCSDKTPGIVKHSG